MIISMEWKRTSRRCKVLIGCVTYLVLSFSSFPFVVIIYLLLSIKDFLFCNDFPPTCNSDGIPANNGF